MPIIVIELLTKIMGALIFRMRLRILTILDSIRMRTLLIVTRIAIMVHTSQPMLITPKAAFSIKAI